MTQRISLKPADALLERLLTHPNKSSVEHLTNVAKTKGSFQIAAALKSYIKKRRSQFIASARPLTIDIEAGKSVHLNLIQVRQFLKNLPDVPLNNQRAAVIERIVNSLGRSTGLAPSITGAAGQGWTSFLNRIRPEVARAFSQFWPELDFRVEYRRVLGEGWNPNNSEKTAYGEGASDGSRPDVSARTFAREDLGALCYLDHLINEHRPSKLEHVVVDEAQEVAPIELLLMRMHSKGNGFTILGDLSQRLSPQGISGWADFRKVFQKASISSFRVRTSLRATKEIVTFTNKILANTAPTTKLVTPLNWHGPKPTYLRSNTYIDMVNSIVADTQALLSNGANSIGVLCKTMAESKRLRKALLDAGLVPSLIGDLDSKNESPIFLGPTYTARGLEFDAVIIAGAQKSNYPRSPLNDKLLYLAATRSVHELHVHWFGPLAEVLPEQPKVIKPQSRKPVR